MKVSFPECPAVVNDNDDRPAIVAREPGIYAVEDGDAGRLVPPVGIEPTLLSEPDFEPSHSGYARFRRL